MRLVVVADVNGPRNYHMGDEAMLEANLSALRRIVPDVEFTVMSGDPDWTGSQYRVESLRRPGLPGGHTGESWTRVMVEAGASGGPWAEWLGDAIVGALKRSAGLFISGGGNVCSSWPMQTLERAALIEVAVAQGIPVVMSGQTLGPSLTPDQRQLLARSLPKLNWLGVREAGSAKLARDLGVPAEVAREQLDDAFFLEPAAKADARGDAFRDERQRWIAVTLDASFGAPERARSLSVLASQLDALADYLHASLVFVPNVGGEDAGDSASDAVAARALAAQLKSSLLQLDLWQPREVRWLIERTAMVVSTRYHPLVFATAAGIPAFGIWTDNYTRAKLRGAMAPAGLEGWCIPLAEAERGSFLPLTMELWHRRDETKEQLARFRSEARPMESQRWEELCRALRLGPQVEKQRGDAALHLLPISRSVHSAPAGAPILSGEQWDRYDRDGYLHLGRLLDEQELEALRGRMDAIMLGRVRYPTLQMQLDTGGKYEDLPEPVEGFPLATLGYRKVQGLESDPLVLELIRREVFREICARHYGAHASISVFRIMMMNKPAGQGTYLPWHQDAGDIWKLDRDPLVTLWVALDPATRANGCVQVIPGTHRLGLLSKNGSTISVADVEHYCPDNAVEYLELEAGEGLLLHNWLLHRSDVNRTNIPRRAISACYMDGRTLNTLSGQRFPIVFGEHADVESTMPFLHAISEENRQLWETAQESARYAKSLIEDSERREHMRREAEQYAKALEQELAKVRASLEPASVP